MSRPLLESTGSVLEARLAHAQHDARLPSTVAGVVRDGELVWHGSRGDCVRSGEQAEGTVDTQYKIGSVTKTMTAALILLARERGELSLADPITRFVPEAPFPYATVLQLLTHASGMTAEPHGVWWERSAGGDGSALLSTHAGTDPVLEANTGFHYSNLGYGLLGQIVEAITGQTWWSALQTQVLTPLQMGRTTYQAVQPAAMGFSVDALTDELTVEPLPDTGAMAPAGQLWSTVTDLARWLTALVDPERSVLSADTLAAMRTPQIGAPEDRHGVSWGLGVSLVRDRGRVLVGHGGSMPGFVCGVHIDADSRVGAVVLSNGAYGMPDVASQLVHDVLDKEPALPPVWRPQIEVPQVVREIVGTWHWGNAPMVLRWTRGELHLAPVGEAGRRMRFRLQSDGTFVGTSGYHRGEPLSVARRDDGVSHLECATFIYTRTPYDPSAPIPGGV